MSEQDVGKIERLSRELAEAARKVLSIIRAENDPAVMADIWLDEAKTVRLVRVAHIRYLPSGLTVLTLVFNAGVPMAVVEDVIEGARRAAFQLGAPRDNLGLVAGQDTVSDQLPLDIGSDAMLPEAGVFTLQWVTVKR